MSGNKFKVGDRVCFTKDISEVNNRAMFRNKLLTISRIINSTEYKVEGGGAYFFREAELISEEIYNSPLFRAMQEDEDV